MQLLKQLPFVDHFMVGYSEGVYEVVGTIYLLLIIFWEDMTRVCMQWIVMIATPTMPKHKTKISYAPLYYVVQNHLIFRKSLKSITYNSSVEASVADCYRHR